MIKKLIVATLLMMGNACYAQLSNATISGTVKNGFDQKVPNCSITLQTTTDSSIVKIDLTDTSGSFEILNVPPGNYFYTIQCTGFRRDTSARFELSLGQNYHVQDIILVQNNTMLTEIMVSGSKPIIEVRDGKTIFNIEGSINAAGSNAFGLLQKSPGVIVDKDDNILLKGKNGVRIYIDGKITELQNKDLSEYLRSINSADIEAIVMISNPSAKYDASGNAGVINIILKKNKSLGTNGSITTGIAYGKSLKSNNSFNLNYRNRQVNFFGNYSNYFGRTENLFALYRTQNDSIFDQHTISMNKRGIQNFKVGMDYFIDAASSAGFIVNGSFSNSSQFNDGNTLIIPANTGMPLKILYATNYLPTFKSNVNYNFNYRHHTKGGTELNIDGDLGVYKAKTTSYQPNIYREAVTGSLIQEKDYRNNTPTDITVHTFKVDYVMPVKGGEIGIGGKYSQVRTKNTFDFYNIVSGADKLDSAQSNKFNFTENINALYFTLSQRLSSKMNMEAGLRMENTNSEGLLVSFYPQTDADVKRAYTDLFPSGSITYTKNANNTFNLSYSRRIDRPGYDDLNPFENKIDELTYQKGNAFLKPQYSNIFEVTHTFQSKYNTTLGYSHIRDFRAQIVDTADKNRTFLTPRNLASQDIFNLNFSAPFVINKWWKAFANINGFHSRYKADFGPGKVIDLDVNAVTMNLQQTFSFNKKVTAEVSAYYNSPSIWRGTFRSYSVGNLDVGIQKVFWNDKAVIKLSNTDLLNTVRLVGVSKYGGVYTRFKGKGESSQFRLNFTYRFGSNLVTASRQHKPGLDEEIKRINGSGSL